MEPGGSLPHVQEPTTCPYPEPDLSSPWQQWLHQRPSLLRDMHISCL